MDKSRFAKKSVAWALIVALVNPATFAPAFARDSDIYLITTTGTTTAEPNVLFILGTNDRMNVAEAWREYDPLAYDSHAEYLWNDTTIISAVEVLAENANAISDASPPVNPFSPWGTWSGSLALDRQQLWQATKAYAQGTQPGDPGARSQYRNYWDASWYYWLPTGTVTTDPRLWSISFNRFRGFVQTVVVPSSRGGVSFPATTANYTVANDFRSFNLCATSVTQLEPSTIFQPTGRAQNAGFMLNQQWVRFEPFLNLPTRNLAGYPGNHTVPAGTPPVGNTSAAPSVTAFYRGYVDGMSAATNTAGAGPGNGPTNVYRDSAPIASQIGAQGQPIRIQKDIPDSTNGGGTLNVVDAGDSYAGWADPAADLGGYIFQSYVANSTANYYYPQAALTALRTTAYSGSYALPVFTGSTALLQEEFAAWKGNRDAAPAFGSMVGTPAYYNKSSGLPGVAQTQCDPVAGVPGAIANQCINFAGGTATWTQPCLAGGSVKAEKDAQDTIRYSGATCINNGAKTCVGPAGNPACLTPNLFPGPALNCGVTNTIANPSFYTRWNNTAAPLPCIWSPAQTTVTVGACAWSAARQAVYIEGAPPGAGWHFYGGQCQEVGGGAPSTAACTSAGVNKTLNGVLQSNVMGGYASPQPPTGLTTLGCSNNIAAGVYSYAGTCSPNPTTGQWTDLAGVYAVSTTAATPAVAPAAPGSERTAVNPALCTISGGSALTIRGLARTYNQVCGATNATVDQTCATRYGAACLTDGIRNNHCPANVTTTSAVGGGYYQAYSIANAQKQDNLYHECLADGGTASNPGSGYPTAQVRTFATNPTPPAAFQANTTYAGGSAAQRSAPYDTNAGRGVAADPTKNIDVYSVNYLNFLYGAKACRDSSGNLITAGPIGATPAGATCSPIARKTRLQVAKDALSGLVTSTDGVRLGLMVYNKTDTTTADEGGNIAFAIRRMGGNAADLPAYNNRALLVTAIQNVTASSRTPLTETMYEAYRYFSGRTPVFGTLGTAAQGGGIVAAGVETNPPTGTASPPGANVDPPDAFNNVHLLSAGGFYNSPMLNNPTVAAPANCQKNYIVMITNGQPEEDYSANAAIKTMKWINSGLGTTIAPRTDFDTNGGSPTSFNQMPTIAGGNPYGPTDLAGVANDGGYIWLDELTYFMSHADVSPGAANYVAEYSGNNPLTTDTISGSQTVVTYTIGFAGVSAPVVQNAAVAATGIYYVAQNAQQLQSALIAAFVAIQNWNPTAASVTVPISSLNRGESSSDVYLAFFGPSPASTWPGTVKKYQLSQDPTICGASAICLLDQRNQNIQITDPITGNAVVDPASESGPNNDHTAWTPTSVVDGAHANNGGTGYVLVNTALYTPDTRNVYTFLSNGVSSSTNLTAASNKVHKSNAAITQAMVGAGNPNQRRAAIDFILGGNPGDGNCSGGGGACTTWTAWPHFAAEHSKPAVVTYDTTVNPPVQYLFYIQNNGMVTAVDTYTGKEKWSFLIEEALPQIPAMQANVNGPEIYVADGSPTLFIDDQNGDGIINGADRVWLYFGMRRGGRVMYAIDITSKDTPIFKWKIDGTGGTGKVCTGTGACASTAAFNELGQTWSAPQVARIRSLGAAAGYDPALIFGGGYDPAEDTVPPGARTMGRAVYVINGNDASLIQSWGVGQGGAYKGGGGNISTYSIPSDVTAINADLDTQNFVDRVYVGDMGGNVWRFDIEDVAAANWRGEQLATLSNVAGEKRKFFYPPAVAPQNQGSFVFDAVYIGSGDKEHPTLTGSTTPAVTDDRMFMLMDDPSVISGGGTPTSAGPSALATPITLGQLLDISDTCTSPCTTTAAMNGSQGWMRRLDNGEKVVSAPTAFFNRLRFGTYAPQAQLNQCTPPGEGRLNEIDALSGDLFALNSGAMNASQRWYSGFLSRGYMSSTQLVVLPTSGGGKAVYTLTCADGICFSKFVAAIGSATKIYWYLEPEQ